jgi:hypothetical protein
MPHCGCCVRALLPVGYMAWGGELGMVSELLGMTTISTPTTECSSSNCQLPNTSGRSTLCDGVELQQCSTGAAVMHLAVGGVCGGAYSSPMRSTLCSTWDGLGGATLDGTRECQVLGGSIRGGGEGGTSGCWR